MVLGTRLDSSPPAAGSVHGATKDEELASAIRTLQWWMALLLQLKEYFGRLSVYFAFDKMGGDPVGWFETRLIEAEETSRHLATNPQLVSSLTMTYSMEVIGLLGEHQRRRTALLAGSLGNDIIGDTGELAELKSKVLDMQDDYEQLIKAKYYLWYCRDLQIRGGKDGIEKERTELRQALIKLSTTPRCSHAEGVSSHDLPLAAVACSTAYLDSEWEQLMQTNARDLEKDE